MADLLAREKAANIAHYTLDLKEVRRQQKRFADMEAHLLVLTQGFTNHDIGDKTNGEVSALRHSSKKISIDHGSSQTSASAVPPHAYSSPTRISKTSNKRSQISSPAAHYTTSVADQSPSSSKKSDSHLTAFFGPSSSAQQAIATADAISK